MLVSIFQFNTLTLTNGKVQECISIVAPSLRVRIQLDAPFPPIGRIASCWLSPRQRVCKLVINRG